MSSYLIGLDIGQIQDFTAICVIEKLGDINNGNVYHVRHLKRFTLGTSYPEIVDSVDRLITRKPLEGNAHLVVDSTGVGSPVVDMFRQSGMYPIIAVTITGGNEVNRNGVDYKVPKRDLVSNLQVLFQSGLLKIAKDLPDARTLIEELLNFKVKISNKGHDSYEAWRENIHDDLVLSVCLAVWYGCNQAEVNFRWL